jgi:hypothetical protein
MKVAMELPGNPRLLSMPQSDQAVTCKAAFRITLLDISHVHFEIQQ